jgi:vacuolar protein sorting-associated protein 51
MIDNQDFDASTSFIQMISSHALEELLLIRNNLTSEIKSLDGNMQTLVYENYNKFISATDTIRSMKNHVESMEEEMNRLESSMLKIQEVTQKVSKKLAPKQNQIKELVNAYDELQKIKSICDLPALLRNAIEQNKNKLHLDFSKAAESFNESILFLNQHKTDTSYISIYQETIDCIDIIKKMIWVKIQDMSLNHEAFTKYCSELALLGEDNEKLPVIYCT